MNKTLSLWLTLSALGALAAPAQNDPTANELAARFERLRQPEVGAELRVEGALEIGRARLTPSAGGRIYELVAEGGRCGVVLVGPGRLVYRVEDRFSIPVARRNLRRAQGVDVREVAGALEIHAEVQGALLYGHLFDQLEAVPETKGSLPPRLAELVESRRGNNPMRDLLRSELNGDPGYAWALFAGRLDEFVLDVDPMPTAGEEQLSRLRKLDSDAGPYAGRRVAEELAAQPIGREWWIAPRFDLAAVDTELSLVNATGDHVRATARTRLQALRDGIRLLSFDLWDETVDARDRLRPYRLARLSVDGAALPYLHRHDQLLVLLPKPLRSGEEVVLEAEIEGDLLWRPGNDSYWRLVGAPWYPNPGVGGQEWASYRITVESADPFVPFASGVVLSTEKTATGTRVSTRLDGPMQRIAVGAGRYRSVTEERDGTKVHVSTYVHPKPDEARRVAGIVYGVRACLEHWLGTPYPFPELQLVEMNQWGWGQAPPGVIFITQEAFLTRARAGLDDGVRETAAWASRGINERIAHEVAHAWFPHVVKVVRSEENWLSESLSEYVSAECLRRSLPDRRQARYLFDRQLKDWSFYAKDAGDDASIYLASHLGGGTERDFDAWRAVLYARGPLVFHAIRRELQKSAGSEEKGDELFMNWIRSYVTNFKFRPGETRHLIGILNQMTGRDWQPFFERHVFGVETPKIP